MSPITFRVHGHPVPQPRTKSRGFNAGGKTFIKHYTPDSGQPGNSIKEWKEAIRQEAEKHRPQALLDGPLKVKARFIILKPKSKPKRVIYPAVKPDVDNLIKAVWDVLNGLLYRDDSQIVSCQVEKVYGDPPGLMFSMEVVED